jgi:4-amino-4-deoxy-L-arabinose transferase-like glycosyltransferase
VSKATRLAGLAVFVIALALRLYYVHESEAKLGLDVSQLSQTDNYVFARWAETIADGDLLCWKQPHAYHLWTQEVAPEDRWLEWYGGEQTYHQAPLYPYLVGAVYAFIGREHLMVGIVQAVLGALTCLLTWWLTSRVVSPRAGLIAGLLLAGMGSFYFYDAFILRDGVMALLTIVLAIGLQSAARSDRPLAWLGAGAALGLFTVGKETGLPLLLLTVMGVAWVRRREPGRAARTLMLLMIGWLLLTGPIFVRNRIVGAPTLSMSTRGPEVFIAGNAAGQTGIGWNPPVDTMRQILTDSNFGLLSSMAKTIATHRADPIGFPLLLWNKTEAFFNAYEVPNNVNFYLHRSHLLSLQLGFVSMWFLAPAALIGLVLGLSRRRQLAIPYLLLIALCGSVIALYVLGRFRLQVLPLMALFAGLAVDWALRAWSARRLSALCLAAVPFGLLLAWSAPREDADPFDKLIRNASIMRQLVKAGNFDRALNYRDKLVDSIDIDTAKVEHNSLKWKLAALNQGFVHFERALRHPEDSAARSLELGLGYTALIPITKRGERIEFTTLAMDNFQRALALDPQIVGAWHGTGMLHGHNNELGPSYQAFMQEINNHDTHAESYRKAGFLQHYWKNPAEAVQLFRTAELLGLDDARMLAILSHLEINPIYESLPPVRVQGEFQPVFDNKLGLVHARRALDLDPENPVVREEAAYALYTNGGSDPALFDEAGGLMRGLAEEFPARADHFNKMADNFEAAKPSPPEGDETP